MTNAEKIQHIENLFQKGEKQEALISYKAFMANAGEQYDLWINYASFLFRCGQYEEAAAMSQKSIAIKPSAEGFHNLGCALKQLGNKPKALEAFQIGLNYNPDFAQTHSDIGLMYEEIGKFEHAIDHYQIITTILPQNPTAWINLARARMNGGRLREALSALRTARKIDDKNEILWVTYAELFKVLNDFEINRFLMEEIATCLKNPRINSAHILGIIQIIFLNQAVIKKLMSDLDDGKIKNFETYICDNTLNWVALKHDVFITMLANLVMQSVDIESMLTALRFHMLQSLDLDTKSLPYVYELLPFIAALGCQCFINEYVFAQSAEEKQALERLASKIKNNLADISSLEIALYACYRPLHELENAAALYNQFQSDSNLSHLLRLQITEPQQEKEIKKNIKTLTPIEDEISQLVRAQYEANPYPRWTSTGTFGASSLKHVLKYLYPYLQENDFNTVNLDTPSTLIAGCGTGRQAIETAYQQQNANILAIDLSASSLAFAIRKTKEYGLQNIEYGIADILKLQEINQKFDVITCGGVLHHLHDPMRGWRILSDCLKPGGFMMVALYSELARKEIILARQFAKEKGFKSDADGIRNLRAEIRNLAAHHPVYQTVNSPDFYSVSTCRDLLMHVQEHRYTARQLKQSIHELGLKFLGFQLPNRGLLHIFAARHPDDPHGLNLDYWDDFERENPDIFKGMYQFWLQKPL